MIRAVDVRSESCAKKKLVAVRKGKTKLTPFSFGADTDFEPKSTLRKTLLSNYSRIQKKSFETWCYLKYRGLKHLKLIIRIFHSVTEFV